MTSRRSISLGDVPAIVLLIVAVLAAYARVRSLWWTYDDAFLLHVVFTHSPQVYFLSSSFWHEMPAQMFVPLLLSEYDALSSITGPLDADAFYLAALLALAATACISYLTFRLWFNAGVSLTATTLLILGAPVCAVVIQLMASHYIVAVGLSFLAVIAFEMSFRPRRSWLTVISAILYLAAALAKEIAVPLPAALLLLPTGTARGRLTRVAPHFIAAALYLAWRRAMIGTFFGGYGWAVRREDVVPMLLSLPAKLMRSFSGAEVRAGLALILITGAFIIWAMRWPQFRWRAAGALLLAVAPIIPVSREMQPRYALVAWICWVSLFAAAIRLTNLSRALRTEICVATLVLVAAVNRAEWSRDFQTSKMMSDEARAFFALGPNSLLRDPQIPPAAMNELKWLKEEQHHGARGGGWFYDDIYLCNGRGAESQIWQYDGQRVSEITPRVRLIARSYCGSIRANAPLEAEFHFRRGILAWRFGPYSNGLWRFVMGDGLQAFDVPRDDAFQIGDISGMSFKIRYASPQGWVTYSPEITIDFVHHPDLVWHR